jgi:DNA-binding SARP family transcriptional activator
MIRFLAGLRTTLVLGVWALGVPALLACTAGSPIPKRAPTAAQIQHWLQDPLHTTAMQQAASAAAWTLWGLITVSLAAVYTCRLRPTRWAPILRLLPGPLQTAAAALLGTAAVTALTSTLTPAAAGSYVTDHQPGDVVAHDAERPISGSAAHDTATTQRPDPTPSTARPSHRVSRGDTLWDIADADLGNPQRWHDIYTLNRGHGQADGYALSDPDRIHVGWVLSMPASATTGPRTPGTTPAPHQRDPGSRRSAHPASADPRTGTVPTPSIRPTPKVTASNGTASRTPAATTERPSETTPANPASPPPAGRPSPAQPPSAPHAADTARGGITLPSQGWISLGLAASIAATAALLRLNRRRHHRLGAPIAIATGPAPTPVPMQLQRAETAGRRDLDPDLDPNSGNGGQHRPGARAASLPVPVPVGVAATGGEISLLDLPATTLRGEGTDAVARAMLASALATGVLDQPILRPVVVTTARVLARLLPDGAASSGLDPDQVTFDGERLIVLAETGDAITHAEEETILRSRLLDTHDAETIADLNRLAGHAEIQPAYVLLVDATDRHRGRLAAVAATAARLDLHVLVLGPQQDIPGLTVTADGVITDAQAGLPIEGRLSTLATRDLVPLLAMIADAAARPEEGTDPDQPADPAEDTDHAHPVTAATELVPDLPTATGDTVPPVRLVVLGPVTVTTERGPVTTGMRSGSYAVLAVLAAYPHGRTLDQIVADLHPDTDPAAALNRLRTDITTARRVLRTATDLPKEMFIVHDPQTGRYRLDPDTIAVDLWQMLAAIGRANTAPDDNMALAALRQAADLYSGDFAANQDRTWVVDYQTTHRNQILNVYSRIAEILETDQPDAALAALDQATTWDPVNEELYQRIMRIQGRQHRPDALRRTMRRLENQLAELGGAEPSDATRRLATRQLRQPMSETRS